MSGFARASTFCSALVVCGGLFAAEISTRNAIPIAMVSQATKTAIPVAGLSTSALEEHWRTVRKSTAQQEYEARRASLGQDAGSQMVLANLCRKLDLREAERVHLNAVIAAQPNHQDARKRLGFVRQGEQWISRRETGAERAKSDVENRLIAKQAPEALAWHRKLVTGKNGERDPSMAIAKHLESGLDEATTFEIWERELSQSTAGRAAWSNYLMSKSGPAATAALIRLALTTDELPKRTRIAIELRARNEFETLPVLLDRLREPAVVRTASTRLGGDLLFRQGVYRETFDDATITVYDRAYDLNGEPVSAAAAGRIFAERQEASIARDMERENAAVAKSNARTGELLCSITGETETKTARQWWDWWNKKISVSNVDRKEIRYVHLANRIFDRLPELPNERSFLLPQQANGFFNPPPVAQNNSGSRGSFECFVAGTPVWTEFGSAPIETLRAGDRVLALDPKTGRRAWKNVLRTTVRPPESLRRLTIGEETIRCTAGHPFAVEGRGWTIAEQLTPGMRLETLNGTLEVRENAQDSKAEQTFNLIVEDAQTYYAGTNRLLTHDNTPVNGSPKPRIVLLEERN